MHEVYCRPCSIMPAYYMVTKVHNGSHSNLIGTGISWWGVVTWNWVDNGSALHWHHNGRDGISNHQSHDCFTFIQAQIKENIKALCHWPLCGEFTRQFTAQMSSNTENVSIWWCHHVRMACCLTVQSHYMHQSAPMLTYHQWGLHLPGVNELRMDFDILSPCRMTKYAYAYLLCFESCSPRWFGKQQGIYHIHIWHHCHFVHGEVGNQSVDIMIAVSLDRH